MGKGLLELGDNVFANDTSLREVYFCGDAPAFEGNNIFSGCGNITAYYPKNSKTWDRSNMTSHGAARVDWQTWTLPLSYFTPNLKSVTPGAKGVTVKWNKLANANGYEVWRSVGNGKLTKVKTISSGSTVSWTDTSVGQRKTVYLPCVRFKWNPEEQGVQCKIPVLSYQKYDLCRQKRFFVPGEVESELRCFGYQIQYAKNNKFTSPKNVKVNGRKVTSRKVAPGFKGTCYIRVRTFKLVDGKNIFFRME